MLSQLASRTSPIGTHTGKTMMLQELRLLLAAAPGPVDFPEYQRVAVQENALDKATAANRSNTLMYLKQLYGLRPDIPVFAAMRELWPVRHEDQPAIALLCAAARDVLLRTTAEVVVSAPVGSSVGGADLAAHLAERYPGRYSASSLKNLGQNIASSWTQGGLLAGARDKHRTSPVVNAPAAVYALYSRTSGGLCRAGVVQHDVGSSSRSERGGPARPGRVRGAERLARYRSSGGMMEITFHHLDGVTDWRPV